METTFTIPTEWKKFLGYRADAANGDPRYLAPPSINCVIDEDGWVDTRMGYEDTTWNLNQANKSPSPPLYVPQYDVTFVPIGTKIYYIDHNNSNAVVDTGITMTDGTRTRLAEYAGDVYATNTTDGLRRIVVGRLNDAAATAGDGNITTDVDFAARLSVFSITSGNLRVNGTNEAFNAVAVSTGVLTLTGTLSQNYSDNTVCIVVSDISSSREKFSKITFWKERMTGMGSVDATNADQPNANVFFGKFALSTTLENIIDFTYGAGGSARELVGKSGKVTNFLDTEDYLYIFKEQATFIINKSDVNITTGASIPNNKSKIHGCLNEDCAVDLGNGEIVFLTQDKRIARIKPGTDAGATYILVEEEFDKDVRRILRLMDINQPGSFLHYHVGRKRLYVHVWVQGQMIRLVYDNNIRAWQPLHTGLYFGGYFERKGILYALAYNDDAIFLMDNALNDNGSPIECYIATGEFDRQSAMWDKYFIKSRITQPTTAYFKFKVNGADAGTKTVNGSSFSFSSGYPLGSFAMGSTALGGQEIGVDVVDFEKNYDIFPKQGSRGQIIAWCMGDGHHFGLKLFEITGRQFSNSTTPLS